MIILGIDPAAGCTGWGIIETHQGKIIYHCSGTIRTQPQNNMPYRLALISSKIEELILTYKPGIVAMEEIFVNTNAASSLKLGFVRGAIMSIIGKFKEIQFYEFKPNTIKKTTSGNGHASKEQMLHMLKVLMPSAKNVESFDEIDALAIAYTATVHHKIN